MLDAVTRRHVWIGLGGLLAALLVFAIGLYAADYGVEATIVEKDCPEVTAETHIGGFEVTRRAGSFQCAAVQTGDVVIYHIRSGDLEYKPQ